MLLLMQVQYDEGTLRGRYSMRDYLDAVSWKCGDGKPTSQMRVLVWTDRRVGRSVSYCFEGYLIKE